MSPSNVACIVGAATSDSLGFDLGKSALTLQVEALRNALQDAGIEKHLVDGLATSHGAPRGVDYDEFVLFAGLDVQWVTQLWSHGRWAATTVASAALAVMAGLASCVAVIDTTTSARGYARHRGRESAEGEGFRDGGGGHGEWNVHGIETPGEATALVAQRYMDKYGATTDDLGAIAVTSRAHAQRNPMAVMRDKEMTLDDYYREPVQVEPFRRADFCLSSEGATCLLVTTLERAREMRKAPIVIAGMEGIRASRDDHIMFARPGLGVGLQEERSLNQFKPPRIYERAGRSRDEIDGLYVYDSFTSNLWMVLERFGFCSEGEAAGYINQFGFDLTSKVPINTNGGLLSEGFLSGYGHLVEMTRQLRGEAGERQINAEVLQWATPRGDSLIFTKAA